MITRSDLIMLAEERSAIELAKSDMYRKDILERAKVVVDKFISKLDTAIASRDFEIVTDRSWTVAPKLWGIFPRDELLVKTPAFEITLVWKLAEMKEIEVLEDYVDLRNNIKDYYKTDYDMKLFVTVYGVDRHGTIEDEEKYAYKITVRFIPKT